MIDLKQITVAATVLIALAAIILSGIAVIGEYEDTLKQNTFANESFTVSSGSGTTANDEVVTFNKLYNSTITFIDGNASTDDRFNITLTTGTVVTSLPDSANYQAEYTYKADTTGSGVASNFSTGIAIFGAFVGVLAISLIGKAIIGLFKKGM